MDQRRCSRQVRRLISIGVTAAVLATTFAPAIAASQPTTDSPSFSTRSIAKVMANTAPDSRVRMERKAPEAAKATPQSGQSGSFFKTRTGLMVIAVMAVGTGYAVYSSRHDRIRGSIR